MTQQADTQSVYDRITQQRNCGHKQIAVLIDPDKTNLNDLNTLTDIINAAAPDLLLVGGSSVGQPLDTLVLGLRKRLITTPIVLFPGDAAQVTPHAHALLFLSLLSGLNPEFLIGQQARAARRVLHSGIEVIPTAYLLIDGGTVSAVQRVSATTPLQATDITRITDIAIAGQLMGMNTIYLEAGSGARNPVSRKVIQSVRQHTSALLMVGGGITTPDSIINALDAGADIVVIGNHFENNPQDIIPFCQIVHQY